MGFLLLLGFQENSKIWCYKMLQYSEKSFTTLIQQCILEYIKALITNN